MRSGVTVAPGSPEPARIDSVDFLRGLAMMCLALVHSVLYFTPLNEDIDRRGHSADRAGDLGLVAWGAWSG